MGPKYPNFRHIQSIDTISQIPRAARTLRHKKRGERMVISYRFRVTSRGARRFLGWTLASIAVVGPGAMLRAQQSGARVAAAAPAPVPDIMLEEIVITAEKRPEKLQDVPVSAAVVSTAALRGANVSDISDINNLFPSVNMNGTINGRVPVGMRGISTVSDEQTVGISSGVAILIDGVPVPSDSQGANQIEDVQSIEVLKGPQATLGGRTAAAGGINIWKRGPTDVFQGSIGATATNDHEYRFNGYVSGPISNRVDFGLSGETAKRGFPSTSTCDGGKTDQKD